MQAAPIESSPARVERSAGEIRAWIVRELSRSMNEDPAAIDTAAPLDALGVDSLAAIGMTGGLASWLNRDLPATLMWDYPSIDAICTALADRDTPVAAPIAATAWPGVVTLQAQGQCRPLFLFPGIEDHPSQFIPLAAHLGAGQPLYGLTVPDRDAQGKGLSTIAGFAAAMVHNLRGVQPVGPYQLAGYSFGGLLAYEAAQQLVAMGQTVSLLALFDTFTPSSRMPRWQRWAMRGFYLAVRPGRMKYFSQRLRRFQTEARRPLTAAQPDAMTGDEPSRAEVEVPPGSRWQASLDYQPAPYAGSLLLFRASDRTSKNLFYRTSAANGWSALVRGGVRVIDLPGAHTTMLNADHAAAAARALREFLAS